MTEITLFDSHKPALDAGNYKLKVNQIFQTGNNDLKFEAAEVEFIVAGEQYSLNSLQVDSIFPPAATIGDFSLIFPHIILNRSTLPWEREAQEGDTDTSWLALLLFAEDEISTSEENADGKKYFVKNTSMNEKHNDSDKKELISVLVSTDKNDLENLLPSYSELAYLTHVRASKGNEKAVVVCKRLPKTNKKNFAHLISLENCYTSGSFSKNAGPDDNIELISLFSWEFFCADRFIITSEVIEGSTIEEEFKKKLRTISGKEYFNINNFKVEVSKVLDFTEPPSEKQTELIEELTKLFRIGHLAEILKHLNRTPATLRLPGNRQNNLSDELLSQGYLNLCYSLKTGREIEAIYRGPLAAKNASYLEPKNPDSNSYVNLFQADEAFRYIKNVNKLDVSYACAWQLGKLLALQNKNFAAALYKWKRSGYQAIKDASSAQIPAAPKLVVDWFNDLKELKSIPYNYLIPDPDFIPFESIRFFSVDELWLKYLIDGAFSIGRISKAEKIFDDNLYKESNFLNNSKIREGFLIHSVAVSGWELVINNDDQEPIVKNKLSGNLLLCIFDHSLRTIKIHQKPESFYFGVEKENEVPTFPAEGQKPGAVANFVKELVQKIEVVQFERKFETLANIQKEIGPKSERKVTATETMETETQRAESGISDRKYFRGLRGGCYYRTDSGTKKYVARSLCED